MNWLNGAGPLFRGFALACIGRSAWYAVVTIGWAVIVALVDGAPYRVYYTPLTKTIVSIEAI